MYFREKKVLVQRFFMLVAEDNRVARIITLMRLQNFEVETPILETFEKTFVMHSAFLSWTFL